MKRITRKELKDFEGYLYEDEKSRATVEKYSRDMARFAEYLGSRELTRAAVTEYKERLARDYSVASANSMIAAINKFFRFLGRPELCVRQFRVQRRVFCPAEAELTREEYSRLVQAAEREGDKRLSLMIQTLCGTGIRVSELENITAEAVRQGSVTVSCKGKTRTVFIVSALQKKLTRYASERGISRGPIFLTASGRPIDRCNVWRQMKALCESARVAPSKVFPHNLRHLFARIFYKKEKDIAKLADVLGHSSINTTRIYIVTTGEEHRSLMESMHLIL